MLNLLHIENIAVIEQADITFDRGFNVLTGETGPDHDKRFEVEVHLNSNVIGRGIGKSKKKAEQEAAREALELMGL